MQPSFSSEAYTPDRLIAGDFPVRTETVTLDTGSLVRGDVLGKITLGAASGAKQSGTGNGTVGAVTLGGKAKVGTYVLTCTAAATDSGTFSVVDPDGERLADLTVAVAYTGEHINLTVADGATDWGVGAIIHVTVAAGSGKYIKCSTDAADGSQYPRGILVEAADATSGDVEVSMYTSGEFNADSVDWDGTYGNISEQAFRDALRQQNIILKTPVSA